MTDTGTEREREGGGGGGIVNAGVFFTSNKKKTNYSQHKILKFRER